MKKALITGGAGGIGRALVCYFAEAGYRVLYTYHREEPRFDGLNAVGYRCDLSDRHSVKMLTEQIKADGNVPDVLVNNAGVGQFSLFQDLTDEEWERVRMVNLDAPMALTKAFLPEMISRKSGCVINISSMWGQVGASCEVGYSTAKAGLIGFTKALAKEVGPSGIRVNCVAPGVIDTPMNRMFTRETMKELAEDTPLGRIGSPEDVAKACLFLAGEDALFITGQVLSVNGGFVIV